MVDGVAGLSRRPSPGGSSDGPVGRSAVGPSREGDPIELRSERLDRPDADR